MIQEIAPKKFDNAYHAKSPKPDDFVLVFRGHGKPDDKILCRIEDGKIVLPTCSELGCEKHLLQYLFSSKSVTDTIRYLRPVFSRFN